MKQLSDEPNGRLFLAGSASSDAVDVRIQDVVDGYKAWLLLGNRSHLCKAYCDRLNNCREAAEAEAVIFTLLQGEGFKLDIGDGSSEPGPDFVCRRDNREIVVEVTCITKEIFASKSGLPANARPDHTLEIQLVGEHLMQRVKNKVRQVQGRSCPRVIAIVSQHQDASFALGTHGAECLLLSDPRLSLVRSGQDIEVRETTDLHHSVFFRHAKESGEVEPCRQSISAVLLVSIDPDTSSVVGILHPEPCQQFDIDLLPRVPFCRITKWPFRHEDRIGLEWVMREVHPKSFPHRNVTFDDSELRACEGAFEE